MNLCVEAGEVRGLLGPNGAGKTTLLRLLFGLIRPDGGSIQILGETLDGLGRRALLGVGGFVEDPCFYPYLSGRANLRTLARLDGKGAGRAEIETALERVGLAPRGEDRVGGYSTGMRQRLGIAAALVRRPRVLLLDEPSSGLDPTGTHVVGDLLRELAQDGVAILLSSHQIGELERVCTTYTFLREGRVVWDGDAIQLERQAPASAYMLVTSDDDRALELAHEYHCIRARRDPRGGLNLASRAGGLDGYLLALGDARVIIRRLELVVSPLESMFFALNGEGQTPDQLDASTLSARPLTGSVA